VIDGKHTGSDDKDFNPILPVLCKHYTGPKPSEC